MTCPIDGRPLVNNAVICGECEAALDRALGDLDWLLEDLDTALSRQARKRPARGAPEQERDDKPLPYELGASKAGSELKGILVGWARLVSEEREVELTCQDTSASISSWLMHHVHFLATHEAGADAYSEIVGAVNNIRRVIDIAPDTRYIGPCGAVYEGVECTDILWGLEGTDTARCKTCGTDWDARARVLQALARVTAVAQTATVMTRSFAVRGIALDTEKIKQWVRYKHLTPADAGAKGRPTYIVAHVARLVTLYEAGQKLTNWNYEQDTAT